MKQSDWQSAYPIHEARLEFVVHQTLAQLNTAQQKRRINMKTVAIALVLTLLLGGVAYAVISSGTADMFGEFYGEELKESLLAGNIVSVSALEKQVGDVIYQLDDVIYSDGRFYGSGVIRAAEGANVVLIPEDTDVNDPRGYAIYYGETAPEGTLSYLEAAQATGAKILLACGLADGLLDENGELFTAEVGRFFLPQEDGSIKFTFEICGSGEQGIPPADTYKVQMYLSNWEVNEKGEWLREEPNNTWLREEWVFEVTLENKE